MKKELAIFRNSIKSMIIYRFNFISWALMAPVRIILFVSLWTAVFGAYGSEKIGFYSLTDMITYYIIFMVCNGPLWSQVDRVVEDDVVMGYLSQKMTKPISYIRQLFSWEMGSKTISIMVESLPILLISYVFLGVHPYDLPHFLLFIVSLFLGMLINFLVMYHIGLLAFWTKKIYGIRRAFWSLQNTLSGGIIPLDLLPGPVFAALSLLPFQYFGFIQVGIFIGRYDIITSLGHILVSSLWVLVLYLTSAAVWGYAKKEFAGVGI
jgi:ABC-2 type transport system permease protein